jgi:deoxyadenosine/deoxycytidine kinase
MPRRVNEQRYIAVAGNMGAGKSSLVRWLCAHYDLEPFFEPHNDNPYLADFYADMPRWAFSSQLFFLINRFKHHKQLEGAARPVVQDRTIYEDAEVFAAHLHAAGHIDDRDWGTYQDLYDTLRAELRAPDLMIYLRCPMPTLQKRIRERGRDYEKAIPAAYLRSLEQLYEAWFARYSRSPTLVIETARLDYVTRLFDRHELMREIDARLGAASSLPGVSFAPSR